MTHPAINPRLSKPGYTEPGLAERMDAAVKGQFGWPVLGGVCRACGDCKHFPTNKAGRVPRRGSCGRLKAHTGAETGPRFAREAVACSAFGERHEAAAWVGVKADG